MGQSKDLTIYNKRLPRRMGKADFDRVCMWFFDPENREKSIADCARDLGLHYQYVHRVRATKKFQDRATEAAATIAKAAAPAITSTIIHYGLTERKNQNDRKLAVQLAGMVDQRGVAVQVNVNIGESVQRLVSEDPQSAVKWDEVLDAEVGKAEGTRQEEPDLQTTTAPS